MGKKIISLIMVGLLVMTLFVYAVSASQFSNIGSDYATSEHEIFDRDSLIEEIEDLGVGDEFEFYLVDDFSPIVRVDKINFEGSGFTLFGGIKDDIGSIVVIKNSEKGFIGMVKTEGKTYMINEKVMEINIELLPPEFEPAVPEIEGGVAGYDSACFEMNDNGLEIDLMVFYTPLAKADALDFGYDIEFIIEWAIDLTNEGYENSGVQQRINLVYMQEIEYDENVNSYDEHLLRLTQIDGYMDEIHELRDLYGADLVQLFVEDQEYCGMAWQMTDASYGLVFEGFGLSVSTWECSIAVYATAHELGHNMGIQHNENNAFFDPAFPYGYGWLWTGDSGEQFKSVMGVSLGWNQILQFSNPDVLFDGVATGAEDVADNARALDDSALVVSNFRCHKLCPGLAADINNDGVVDVQDLIIVIVNWGLEVYEGDVDGDGVVGVLDLIEIIVNWGVCEFEEREASAPPVEIPNKAKNLIIRTLGDEVWENVEKNVNIYNRL